MMAKFYAFDNTYGVGKRGTNHERMGRVVVFWSRAARNEWVNSDSLRNGNYHREIITAKDARREMIHVAYDYMINKHVVWGRDNLRYLPINTIAKMYAQVMD